MAIVLSFGNAAVGFTHSAEANVHVNAGNPADALPLASGWLQTNWTASNNFFSLYISKKNVFTRIWDSFNGGRMFLTTDDGTNWTQIGSADSSIDILSIVMLDSRILAGTWNGFIQSTDNGTTWNAVTPTGIPADTAIWSIVMINTTLFAGTTGGIYKSSDNGNTWTDVSSGIAVNARITSIVASGDAIFAGSASNGVFKTTNSGTSWTAINSGLTDTHISQLVVLDTKLFAVTLTGVFISDNSGTSWEADNSDLKNVNCFVVVNDQLFAGTDDNGAYLSIDNGVTWTSFSTGIPANTRVWSLDASTDGIFAGTSSGIWVTASPIEVKVEREIPVPLIFTLKQNFPNPFNPSTTIQYALPVQSTVKLVIYNILGQVVKELVNAEQSAGYQSVVWNAAAASGMYFYRLEAVSTVDPHQRFVQVKKMLLLH
jgi:photosystem II stability/assembly factor-like uncharacterized protein